MKDGFGIRCGYDFLTGQHLCMGLRTCDVLGIQFDVEINRGIDRLHYCIGAGRKTAAPHLVTGTGIAHLLFSGSLKIVKLNTRTLVGLAVLIGIGVVVFGGVYGIWGSVGNQDQQVNACMGSKSLAERLEGLNTGQVAAFVIADTPKALGALTFKDENGAPASLEDYRGKTVLLNLWATWCAPCREEMPALDALQEAAGSSVFAVLPVSVDLGDDVKPKKFYTDAAIKSLPFRHDGTMSIFNDLKKMSLAVGMPVTILVDGEGCALGSMNGPANWASEDAKAMISAVVNDGS